MNAFWEQCLGCARLNLRVLTHAARGQWLSAREFSTGYDRVADSYDAQWLSHLCAVTSELLNSTSDAPPGPILDLGCGTGYTTAHLAERYPDRRILAVDISEGMLEKARRRCPAQTVEFRRQEMLEAVQATSPESVALIVSAWSLGYSKPKEIIHAIGKALAPGGVFAFVVNRMDTLSPVFTAFRRCMVKFPEQVQCALWPRFPRDWDNLAPNFARAGLVTLWQKENAIPLEPPEPEAILPWLLQTGVLAGFDAVLPLREGGPAAEYVEAQLEQCAEPLEHHYIAGILRKENP